MNTFEVHLFNGLAVAGLIVAAAVFILLFFITAPYGRHVRRGWGPGIDSRWGWVLMEFPAVTVFTACFLSGRGLDPGWVWVFPALWLTHYVHRAFVFPFRLRERRKQTPLVIIASAILFNLFNGYLNGRYLGVYSAAYDAAWLADPRFGIGVALFLGGFVINLHSDQVLIGLRVPGESGYKIPHGGCYRWVSCPNYFGELMEWGGWAIATWSLPGLVFFIWTAANLVPRAYSNHRWYQGTFAEYPAERRALIPYIF